MTATNGAHAYPFGPAERLDLHPTYGELQREAPMVRVSMPYGGEAWMATRYEEVKAVLVDQRFSRAACLGADIPRVSPFIQREQVFTMMDPPYHTRIRTLVSRAFTARRMEQLTPRLEEIMDEVLQRIIRQGAPADLVEEVALPFPMIVICELLGVPLEDRADFRVWTDTALALTAFEPEEMAKARKSLQAYLAGQIEQRRKVPADDLVGALVTAREADDSLTEQEIVMVASSLLLAGYETTANQIGNFVYTLLTRPDQLARLKAEPDLVGPAVDELLRFIPMGNTAGNPRIATEDVELGGVTVRAGEAVLVHMVLANRDERAFDNPDELDLSRCPANMHLSFGHGVHHCLGSQLAKIELRIALSALWRHFPNLRLAVAADEVPWKQGRLVRGPEKLLVEW